MKKHIAVLLLFVFIFTAVLPTVSHADEVYARLKCTSTYVYAGASFSIVVVADGTNISMMQGSLIEYDHSKATLSGTPTSEIEGWEYSEGKANFLIGNDRSTSAVSGKDLVLVKFRFKASNDVKIGETLTFRIQNAAVATDGSTGFTGSLQCKVQIVERPKNDNTNLMVLRCNEGTLSPEFKPSVLEYTMTVGHTVSAVTVIAVPAGEGAEWTVKGDSSLSYGSNTVRVTVKAENGSEKTYTITVNRNQPPSDNCKLSQLAISGYELSPAFDPSVYEYALSVPSSVRSLSINAKAADEHAKVSVTGNSSFKEGQNAVTVTVTAENGSDTASYVLHVERDRSVEEVSTLSSLSFGGYPVSPVFDASAAEQNYTVNVPYEVSDFSLLSAVMQGKYSTIEIDQPEELSVGENTVRITVTSEGGSRKNEYTLTVIRDKSGDATLKSLTCSAGTLTPEFSPDTFAYALLTDGKPGMISFEAIPNDEKASAEQLVFLPKKGVSLQTIRCTAPNGTEQVYTIVIVTPDAAAKKLTIDGTPAVGQTLTAKPGGMPEGGTFTWYLEDAKIENKTDASYTVADGDAGKQLRVEYAAGGDKAVSDTVVIGGSSSAPTGEKGDGAGSNGEEPAGKGADAFVVILIALLCLALGCGVGFFFTKRKYTKNDR